MNQSEEYRLPGQRRNTTSVLTTASSSNLCQTENEWIAELKNRTESTRLAMYVDQVKREEKVIVKNMKAARRHMECRSAKLRQNRDDVMSRSREARPYTASPTGTSSRNASKGSSSCPRHLLDLMAKIPPDHEHGHDLDLTEYCQVCADIDTLIANYRDWKKISAPTATRDPKPQRRMLFNRNLTRPYLEATPLVAASRTVGRSKSQVEQRRRSATVIISGGPVFAVDGARDDVSDYERVRDDVDQPARVRDVVSANEVFLTRKDVDDPPTRYKPRRRVSPQKQEEARQAALGGRVRTFVRYQTEFNKKNPMPQDIQLRTEQATFRARPNAASGSQHMTRSRMVHSAMEQLGLL